MKREEKENILIAMGSEWLNNFCQQCGKPQQCGYVNRNLEDKCPVIQETMEGWELGWQDAIEKACEWLKRNFNMPDDFESHFSKAMEEQQ